MTEKRKKYSRKMVKSYQYIGSTPIISIRKSGTSIMRLPIQGYVRLHSISLREKERLPRLSGIDVKVHHHSKGDVKIDVGSHSHNPYHHLARKRKD